MVHYTLYECFLYYFISLGRVAAGAIAEKYLKLSYGVEIVAFVSSVGKIHLPTSVSLIPKNPDEDDDTAEDALSPEFISLLGTITRQDVDKHPTRCPHPETAEKMTSVSNFFFSIQFLVCKNADLMPLPAHSPS